MTASSGRDNDPYYRVWQKIRYGRRYSELFDLARDIKRVRPIIKRVEETKISLANLDRTDAKTVEETALALIQAAATSSKKLREIAAALDAEKRKDPFHENLLRAYQDCTNDPDNPPTLRDLRAMFVRRFGQDWAYTNRDDRRCKSDFSVRKTLRMLGLPLADAKRGRPSGAQSQIGNPPR